jgi:hypothetical protein
MDTEAGLAAELAALTARLAALRSADTDAGAAAAALADLAAPAYALPGIVPSGRNADADNEAWRRWLRVAFAGKNAGLCDALAPLLLDERFTDAALALVVAVTASFPYLHNTSHPPDLEIEAHGLEAYVPLHAPLTTLLARAVAAGLDDAAPTERTEQSLLALAHLTFAEQRVQPRPQGGLLQTRNLNLEASLLSLLRRTPTDEHDGMASAAAMVLCNLEQWVDDVASDSPSSCAAVLAAAVSALPAASGAAHRHAVFGTTRYTTRYTFVSYLAHFLPAAVILASLIEIACETPSTDVVWGNTLLQPADMVRALLLAQPGALAALARILYLAQATDGDSLVACALSPTPDALCRAALLDAELCLDDLLRVHPRAHDPVSAAQVRERVADACTDAVSQQLLRHPPRARRLEAAAAVALLAEHSAAVAALLPLGDRLETLSRAYVRACSCAQPWQDVGLLWVDAALQKQRHERLRMALRAAIAAAQLHCAPDADADDAGTDALRPNKRARGPDAGAVQLRASDVNTQRHDSVTLLVCGTPLYVNAMLMEAASPLLADLLSGVAAAATGGAPLPPVPLPPPANVAPDAFYALVCFAVEHTYTGAIQELSIEAGDKLLSLWCVARHLQMAALQAFCCAALAPSLHAAAAADDAALLRDVAGVAARHGCDALRWRVAAALLAAPDERMDAAVATALDAGAADGGDAAAASAACDDMADAMAALCGCGC